MNILFSDLGITAKMVYLEMGYKRAIPDSITVGITESLIKEAYSIVKPKYYFQIYEGAVLQNNTQIRIENVNFDIGTTISNLMVTANLFAVFTATAGKEYQAWLDSVVQEKDMLKQFILDAIGSCIAECAGDYMERCLEKEIINLKHTNRFSPGYCGWHVSQQKLLFSLLPDNICDITLNDSSLMNPIKSISGIIGIGENVNTKVYGCAICEMKTCYNKKTKINL